MKINTDRVEKSWWLLRKNEEKNCWIEKVVKFWEWRTSENVSMMLERMKKKFESFKDDVNKFWTVKADKNDLFMIIKAEEKLWSFKEDEHKLWLFVREKVQVSSLFLTNV